MGACLALGSLASCVSVNLSVFIVTTGFVQFSVSCRFFRATVALAAWGLFSSDFTMSTQRHVKPFIVA